MAKSCVVCRSESASFANVGGPRALCSHHITLWTISAEAQRAIRIGVENPHELARTAVAFQDWVYRTQKESQP